MIEKKTYSGIYSITNRYVAKLYKILLAVPKIL